MQRSLAEMFGHALNSVADGQVSLMHSTGCTAGAQPDYIPGPDADFALWSANFSTQFTAAPTSVGLVAGDATAYAALQTTWVAAYAAAINPATRTSVTIAAKDTSRAAIEFAARGYASIMQAFAGTTDAERTTFGLTVPTGLSTPITEPTTRPLVQVLSNASNQHTVRLRDEATPLSLGKPEGVTCAEIWVKVDGDPPSSVLQCQYRGDATRFPFTVTFAGGDTGKPAHYITRWKTATALIGPESPVVTATIAA